MSTGRSRRIQVSVSVLHGQECLVSVSLDWRHAIPSIASMPCLSFVLLCRNIPICSGFSERGSAGSLAGQAETDAFKVLKKGGNFQSILTGKTPMYVSLFRLDPAEKVFFGPSQPALRHTGFSSRGCVACD